jgi:Sec-independent protein secretion pathway component TatC
MIECIPLYLLYGLSILLSRFFLPHRDEPEEALD